MAKKAYQFVESDGGRVAAAFTSEQRDCTVRALAHFAGITYAEAHSICKRKGRLDGRGMKDFAIQRTINEVAPNARVLRWMRSERPTIAAFARANPRGVYYIVLARHACTIKDGVLLDTWRVGSHCRVHKAYQLLEES